MLNSYYGEITGLRPPWKQYPISRERLEKIERYVHASDKARSAGAELLLNYGLKNCVNGFVPPAAFETGEHGKPIIKQRQKGLVLPDGKPIQVNLSHSGDYAACVIGDRAAGIDIEKEKTGIRPGIMRVLSEEERQAVEQSDNRICRFFDFWVLKESYMKAVGTGFTKPPSSFSVRLEHGRYRIYEQGVLQNYECYLYQLPGGYHLAVCAEGCDEREVPVLEKVLWDETKGQYVRMPDGF